MKLSVSIITYNHEKYIAQAIESVLMQKTDFSYEIVIGEDDSKDNTRTIVVEYKKRYPNKIRLFLNDRRNVIYINGRPTGRWNLSNNLAHARGEYVALLDGDDYWTDAYKLQKQVSFLDKQKENVACFHSVIQEYSDKSKTSEVICYHPPGRTYSMDDMFLIQGIAPCSVVFRRSALDTFPEWFYRCPSGDKALFCLLALHGNFAYLDESLSVYRVHNKGIWTGQTRPSRIKSGLRTWELIQRNLYPKRRQELQGIKYAKAQECYKLMNESILDRNYSEALLLLLYAAWLNPTKVFKPKWIRGVLSNTAQVFQSRRIRDGVSMIWHHITNRVRSP